MPKKGPNVRDVDKGWKRVMATVEKLAKTQPTLAVGIVGTDKHSGSSLSVAEIGTIHEFGTKRIPQRSFLRRTLDRNRVAYNAALSGAVYISITDAAKQRPDVTLSNFKKLGMRIVGEIQREIARGIPPPLAESTIARKGSSKPLIDTGQLRRSITYVIGTQAEIRKRAR